jgi:hypothetical protein
MAVYRTQSTMGHVCLVLQVLLTLAQLGHGSRFLAELVGVAAGEEGPSGPQLMELLSAAEVRKLLQLVEAVLELAPLT